MARAPSVIISDEQYKRAIELLDQGGTKKAACEILGINYSTTRLATLISNYVEGLEKEKELRARKRGTPVTNLEIVTMIQMYFDDESIEAISKRMHRSTAVVKYYLENSGAMLKAKSTPDPLNPTMLPEICMCEQFEIGEHVWVAAYNCTGEIISKIEDKGGELAYKVYLLDKNNHRFVFQPWYDLGSLQHLKELGLDINTLGSIMNKEERNALLAEALRKARMRSKEDK